MVSGKSSSGWDIEYIYIYQIIYIMLSSYPPFYHSSFYRLTAISLAIAFILIQSPHQ
jgi:hypothetical protein